MRIIQQVSKLFIGGTCAMLLVGSVAAEEAFKFVAEELDSSILSFESTELPGSLETGNGSKAVLSDRRYINGSQSLHWTWEGGSEIYFNRKIPFATNQEAFNEKKRGALSVFSFWIYNETALPGEKLRIEFGGKAGSKGICGFDFGLDFTGWRTCSVSFTRDMNGSPKKGMSGLRFIAPEGIAQGELFIDRIILATIDDIRYQWPDHQVPFVAGTGAATMKLTPIPAADEVTVSEEQTAGVDELETRFEASLLQEVSVGDSTVTSIREKFDDLELVEQDGAIRGRHVLFTRRSLRDRQDSVYPRDLTEQDEYLLDQYAELRDYTDFMTHIAQVYRSLPPESEDAAALRDIFILMSRHLLDQGWQEGSSLYTTHHFGYAARGWYAAVFLMRDELEKAGILDPVVRSLVWYMREKVDFAKMEFDPKKGSDLDYLNTITTPHMLMLLSMPDGPSKTALVARYSGYLSDLLAADTYGTVGGIKADGTGFHHGGNYPGYSFPAFRSCGELCSLLNGSPFALREDALKNLNKAVTAAVIYSNPETGIGLCGRHPFGESKLSVLESTIESLAACGHPVELNQKSMPDGHWSFNYGCFGIHRWNGKMVTLKGFNKYVWSMESYTRDNRYGRYQSNGGVQIYTAEGRKASGFEQEGWDWNRNPGTTAIYRPLDKLENPKKGTLMYRSDVRFSGSSHLQNRYGIFAVEIQEPEMKNFDPSFTARKSMFCFDNRIVCLGSGIVNKTSSMPTETILFQHVWKDGSSKVWMNDAEPIAALPAEKTADGASWLVDAHGNGYYVAAGDAVKLTVAKQESRHNKSKEPTSGTFAAAWIDHGAAPKDASYEYAILLDGTPEKTAAFAKEPPYTVLRNDKKVQIVHDKASGVYGYAFFTGGEGPEEGRLHFADQSCMVMIQEKEGTLDVSLGNGDLRIPAMGGSYTCNEESRPGYAEIIVRGAWKLEGENGNIELADAAGNTRITVNKIQHAIPVQMKLIPAK